ncbi:MAG TPA: glycoside hydrolase family 172 protein [Verrucomicrobiae bacterium]
MNKLAWFFAAAFVCGGVPVTGQALSYPDLVSRLTDLEYLATLPLPGEQGAQWSSYDRKSKYDSASGRYVAWDANGDGDGYIRKEGDKFVMAEMQGPGCIWRIWSAMPKAGHVRIYLDGASEPAVDLPFVGYFDGKNQPFTRSALVHTVARGWNNYTPIPYQKSCKIVADQGWGQYFHFTYETFPAGTKVPTFKRELSNDEAAALDHANEILARCEENLAAGRANAHVTTRTVSVAGNKTATVTRITGPRAIANLRVKLDLPPSPADREVLRELALQIRWDGEKEPSVWSPLGDFFGTAPGADKYRSYPLGLGNDGWWYCNWYMPFARSAEVELVNDGKPERQVKFEIVDVPCSAAASRVGRFHAKWHRDAFLPSEPERWIDWPMVKTEGAGRFVGVMLHIWNPRGSWWGEGDEKFFVDGEKFASTFGTGSEDYFGYAWCDPALFQNAFHNQTHQDGNNKGHVAVNRWHIADQVPFHTGFEADIEKYYPNQRPTLYAATVYWYLAADGKDLYRPVRLDQRLGYWGEIQTFKVKGALEGERLKVLSKTGGDPHEQGLTEFGAQWSNDAHLWWTDAKPGDKLDLALPVPQTGKYQITMQFTKAPDYGIAQLYVDGEKLGEPLDLYHPAVIPTGPMVMGARDLSSGDHKLTVAIVGANEKAVKSYMFGLDYVKLDPK